jgi:hypothetical protein
MAVPPVLGQEAAPPAATQNSAEVKNLMSQEELDQVLAPIALYPDALLSQILMASTYPLEIVQADRWVDSNKFMTDDAQAAELEKQPWDPSVKSLVNFPQVLDMMNEKLDWTIKLGDAFIGQQKQVMDSIQSLRAKAQAAGNLQSNTEQTITVNQATTTEPQYIVIEPASPQVIYVPVYNPTIVYGTWWYPGYPPYYYYPPYYPAYRPAFWFGAGIAVGMAWGYAWGRCNWGYGNVNVNINRNININNKYINRNDYQNRMNRTNPGGGPGGGRGGDNAWRHDPSHRRGVAYRDNATARNFGLGSSDSAQAARDNFRGRTDNAGLGNNGRPSVGDNSNRPSGGNNLNRPSQGAGQNQRTDRNNRSSNRGGAFDDVGRGNATRDYSQRGQSSRSGNGAGQRPAGGGGRGGAGGGGGRGGGGGGGRR